MKQKSLEDLVHSVGDPVRMLRHSQIGAYVYPVVPTEFSNWRTEQLAWRESAVLFDQSHHMAEITISGPDALALCSRCTINSFAGFEPGKAKQMITISHDGFVMRRSVRQPVPAESLRARDERPHNLEPRQGAAICE